MTSLKRKGAVQVAAFVFGVYLLSTAGGILMAKGQNIGGLVFVAGPLIMAVILRAGRKGWKNSGIRFNFKGNGGLYLISLLAYPVSFVIVLIVGVLSGCIIVSGSKEELIPLVLLGIGMQVVPRMIFALMEEFGWRGFLDPKLESLGLSDIPRYIITGLIWGGWHIPLIISTDYTDIPLQIFIPIFLVGIVVVSATYGVIRKATKSVWPAVLMHGTGNTIAFAILSPGVVEFNNPVLMDLSPASITMILIWIVISLYIFRLAKIWK